MTVTMSIIIPTIGRPSLKTTLASAVPQLVPGDEILVVGDGPQPEAEIMARAAGVRYLQGEQTRCWGHAQRNLGMLAAKGSYLAFMDDDDAYLPGALDQMRWAAGEWPGKLFIFRMLHLGRTLWREPAIAIDNISTQMYFFPNRLGRLAKWGPNLNHPNGRGGDFCFARDTAALWAPDQVVFRTELIAELVVHANGLPRIG